MTDYRNTYRQTREVLALARTVYRKLTIFYGQQASAFGDKRISMLMDYMQRHEKHMQVVLTECLAETSEAVLDTYHQFEPEEIDALLDVDQWRVDPDTSLNDVLALVRRFDDIMRDFYARAAQMAQTEKVARVFQNLKSLEEEKRNTEMRDILFLQDI